MNIIRCEFEEYKLPFVTPLITSGSSLRAREGFIIRVEDDEGRTGTGDIAPLPEFGSEDHIEVRKFLSELKTDPELLTSVHNDPDSIYTGLEYFSHTPAVRFGIEQALIDLACKQTRKTTAEFTGINPGDRVRVNALIGLLSPEKTSQRTREFLDEGYGSVKMKIGRKNIAEDLKCLDAVRKISDKLELRLDVNGAWKYTEAAANLQMIAPYDVEYVEDPVHFHGYKELRNLRAESPVKIALDEPVKSINDVSAFSVDSAADVLIIKPVMCGGILTSIQMMRVARQHNIPVVISSVFESAIGRKLIVLLASSLPERAHGLDTGRIFAKDVIDDPLPVLNGEIKLSHNADL